MSRAKDWNGYLEYLAQWANDHAAMEFYSQSPACFDEWNCNENMEE